MKEHLNDYEKRIWEGIDKDAEEIKNGGSGSRGNVCGAE